MLAPLVEKELIKAWQTHGDEAALEAITRAYARRCYSVAARYTQDPHRQEDLAQEGSFGIRRALEKYDFEKGTKFSSYSLIWIQNFIALAASRVLSDITVPARAFNDARMGRMEPGRNDSAVCAVQPFVFLDAPTDAENETPKMDAHVWDERTPEALLADTHRTETIDKSVGSALANLSVREAEIIRRRRLQEHPDTLELIAQDFNLTRERIRQIEITAMEKMRKNLTCSGFSVQDVLRD
jgi:RNA polymerase sigma factor (sigma-70 family)